MTKSKRYAAVSASRTPNLLATPVMNHTVAMKRRAYLSMWNDRSLQQIEPGLNVMMSKLLDDFSMGAQITDAMGEKNWSTDVDLHKACEPFGFDATMTATLGKDPGLTESVDKRWMLQAASMAAWRASVVGIHVVNAADRGP